ncbi:MAG: response regulator transcription factor [Brumimicrobium sp.]
MKSILIADDHKIIVEGLQKLISLNLDQFILYTAHNKGEIFSCLENNKIDLILLDLKLGQNDSRLFIKDILSNHKNLKIVIVSSFEEIDNINHVLRMGCHGFIGKSESSTHILKAIMMVLDGEKYISGHVKKLFEEKKTGIMDETDQIQLTKREREVLTETLKEKSIKEIAETLFVTEKTVENHRSSLFIKFDVKNVSGLVKKAILSGFLEE